VSVSVIRVCRGAIHRAQEGKGVEYRKSNMGSWILVQNMFLIIVTEKWARHFIAQGSTMLKDMAAKIKLLIIDVDGVMTDGRIMLNDRGEEIKSFNVKDGQGLRILMRAGVEVVLITGRMSKAVKHRARDLGIKEFYQGIDDKESLCIELLEARRLNKEQLCCIGDDLPDIPMFKHAGLSIAVADAALEVRDAAHHVTKKGGGKGAVREVCELILKAQGSWPNIIKKMKKKGSPMGY
jgi:3-deoxy-D-manno-octulosonate 8-phosphate phosphatase (KDO 8-P phosphatase)